MPKATHNSILPATKELAIFGIRELVGKKCMGGPDGGLKKLVGEGDESYGFKFSSNGNAKAPFTMVQVEEVTVIECLH